MLQVLLQAPILPATVQDLHCPTDEEPRQQGQSRLGEGGAQQQGRGPGVLQVPRACLAKAGARQAWHPGVEVGPPRAHRALGTAQGGRALLGLGRAQAVVQAQERPPSGRPYQAIISKPPGHGAVRRPAAPCEQEPAQAPATRKGA